MYCQPHQASTHQHNNIHKHDKKEQTNITLFISLILSYARRLCESYTRFFLFFLCSEIREHGHDAFLTKLYIV
jgi:hypothetical protein